MSAHKLSPPRLRRRIPHLSHRGGAARRPQLRGGAGEGGGGGPCGEPLRPERPLPAAPAGPPLPPPGRALRLRVGADDVRGRRSGPRAGEGGPGVGPRGCALRIFPQWRSRECPTALPLTNASRLKAPRASMTPLGGGRAAVRAARVPLVAPPHLCASGAAAVVRGVPTCSPPYPPPLRAHRPAARARRPSAARRSSSSFFASPIGPLGPLRSRHPPWPACMPLGRRHGPLERRHGPLQRNHRSDRPRLAWMRSGCTSNGRLKG
eukprot:gene8059-biopygen2869